MNSQRSMASRRAVLAMLGAAPVAAGAVLAAPGVAGAGAAGQGHIPKELRPGGEYDKAVAQFAAEDTFSGTVLLAHRGKPVLERAYGMADKAKSIPNRMDTLFSVGSICKAFTSVAVMQLARQDKIDLHATVGTYLDGFRAEVADTVTVHQLLTHTGGMGDHGADSRAWDSVEEVFEGTLDVIRGRQDLPEFTPGTEWRYSNSGFHILGAIVRAASNEDYYKYIREHVFDPAGMERTGFYTRPQVLAADDIAHPYATHPQTGERIDSTTRDDFPFVGTPAGGAFSTAEELMKFIRALHEDGTLLPSAFADLATNGKAVQGPDQRPDLVRQNSFYGYGFEVTTLNDRRICGHSGGSSIGVSCMLDFHPALDWVSVSLSNYSDRYWPLVNLERTLITQQ
ncbi:serine hydrolase domain-containing protein [Jiangella asiatica]|uniref:Class A beta-lactamase-related serine hydrolase n=1 Tax=Jiangella asiatica TaxID=2530372 RepID=A0A4R5DQJ1_9ACTN|nr:serine hydrolase domain-containing protein [Jiangella asiatica]TDE14321.1 class A beta-lactamase-related serine hydrolase [Jiangella asiatica]